ncbi:hypothetical protein ACWD3J_17190 [Streptomyces sp. NPDC002755]
MDGDIASPAQALAEEGKVLLDLCRELVLVELGQLGVRGPQVRVVME